MEERSESYYGEEATCLDLFIAEHLVGSFTNTIERCLALRNVACDACGFEHRGSWREDTWSDVTQEMGEARLLGRVACIEFLIIIGDV